MLEASILILKEVWAVASQMSPYLLFGFLMAGILSVWVSPEWVERHLGRGRVSPVIKSVLFGVPLPLCSCSVIPVTASLRRHGASRGATVGFLLATPQTGVDSIVATWGTLGPVFGIFRPVIALVTGIVGGLVNLLFDAPSDKSPTDTSAGSQTVCCAGKETQPRWLRSLRYGFYTLPKDIGWALLLGIVLAGLISALIPQGALEAYLGGGILAIIVLMLAGIPIYVCSTASIPLAIGFMHMGASPGAALAFLIAGPATNVATIMAVWKMLGRTSAVIYLTTVAAGALFSGLLLDLVFSWLDPAELAQVLHVHKEHITPLAHLSTVVLLGVFLFSFFYKPSASVQSLEENNPDNKPINIAVAGMTCDGCRNRVHTSLSAVPGVVQVKVDLKAGKAVILGQELDESVLLAALQDSGFQGTIEPPAGT